MEITKNITTMIIKKWVILYLISLNLNSKNIANIITPINNQFILSPKKEVFSSIKIFLEANI